MGLRFVVFEGVDGAGKTTQANLLVRALRRRGRRVLHVREPGATGIGENVRRLLLRRSGRMSVECELYLFMAARAQLVAEKIRPALREGRVVVCDRFLYSSAAYQGAAGGLGIANVLRTGRLAVDGVRPDRVIVLDLDPSEALVRLRGRRGDRISARGLRYQEAVRRGFREVARRLGRRAIVVDASRDARTVHRDILVRLGIR